MKVVPIMDNSVVRIIQIADSKGRLYGLDQYGNLYMKGYVAWEFLCKSPPPGLGDK